MFEKLFNTVAAIRSFPYREATKRLLIDTPAEIAIGAVAFGSIFGAVSYHKEAAKQGQIPLAFSELGATVFELETQRGIPVPAMTRYYASLNDTLMQVFEANNIAHNTWGISHKSFAYELEKKVETTMRIHTLITDYAARMPADAQKARVSITPMTKAARDIAPAIKALDAAWDEDHDDYYRTEYYTEQECSGVGQDRVCHTVTKSRQVYDYTVHTYTYDRQQGELAARLLRDFMQRNPDIRVNEELITAWKTEAENEWAIRESRKRLPGYKEPTQEEYLRYTNTWATGSNFAVLAPKVYDQHGKLGGITPRWAAAAPKAKSDRYRTYSRSDSGPQEFQIAEAALSYAVSISRDVNTIDGGMAAGGKDVPALQKKIVTYVNAVLHGGKGDPDTLKGEIMQEARALYTKNYAGGFDMYPAKWGMVVLWTVLGLMAGGAVGLGADRLLDRHVARRGQQHPRLPWQSHMKDPGYRLRRSRVADWR